MSHIDATTISTSFADKTGSRNSNSSDDVNVLDRNYGEPEVEADRNLVEVYAVFCLLAVLALTGAGGNMVVLRVFSRPPRRDKSCCPGASATVYVLSLAAADLVTCIFLMPSTIYMEHVQFYITCDFFCQFYEFLKASNVPFSALIMVAIAVDRYICICHPHRQTTLATGQRARCVVAFLTLVAIILGVCTAIRFSVNHRINIPWKNAQTTSSFELYHRHLSTTTDNDVMLTESVITEDPEDYSNDDQYPIVNTGYCGPTDRIVGDAYEQVFLTIHSTMYPLCLLAIVVLYGLTYRSVLDRRARRQRLRSPALPRQTPVNSEQSLDPNHWTIARLWSPLSSSFREQCCRRKNSASEVEATARTASINITCASSPAANVASCLSADLKDDIELASPEVSVVAENPSKSGRDKNTSIVRLLSDKPTVFKESGRSVYSGSCSGQSRTLLVANLRTAAMLLVVTVVFVVCYTPAFFMSLGVVPYQMMSFYLYFVNSVANPVIYSFMNRYFRRELAAIACRPVYGYYGNTSEI